MIKRLNHGFSIYRGNSMALLTVTCQKYVLVAKRNTGIEGNRVSLGNVL